MLKPILCALPLALAAIAAPAPAQSVDDDMTPMGATAQMGCTAYQFLLANVLMESNAEEAAGRLERGQRWFALYVQEQNLDDETALANVDSALQTLLALYNGNDEQRGTLAEVGTNCVLLEQEYDEELKIAKVKRDLTQ